MKSSIVQIDFYNRAGASGRDYWIDIKRTTWDTWPETTNRGYSPSMASMRRLCKVLNQWRSDGIFVNTYGWSWHTWLETKSED